MTCARPSCPTPARSVLPGKRELKQFASMRVWIAVVAVLALVGHGTAARARAMQEADDELEGVWVTASAQTPKHLGDATHPSVRYSHDVVVWGDKMVVTHGAHHHH